MTALPDPRRDISALQNHASDPAFSIWVGASAGSGKTKVLADRVTRLLLASVPPQRILCLTFTKAAAAEMSIRLTQRLSDWATCAEEDLDKALASLEGPTFDPELRQRARRLFARVLACPGGMRIQTIHAFAQEILRRFPIEAGLSPSFAVMEEVEAQTLWREALMNVLEDAAEAGDEALRRIAQNMTEGTLVGLLKDISGAAAAKIEAESAKRGGFAALMKDMRAALDLGSADNEDLFLRQAVAEGAFAQEALAKAIAIILEKGTKAYTTRASRIKHWLAQDEEGRRCWFEDYTRAFFTKDGEPFADIANKNILEKHPEVEEALKNETTRLQSVLERLDSLSVADETEAVLSLALRVLAAYRSAKESRAALDFDDMIARTLAVLSRPDIAPWVLYKLDGGIDHILLDESQDTNPSQWEIVRLLADDYFSGEGARAERPRSLFVVGDEKQSIFSFHGADPEAFESMRGYFSAKIRAAKKPYDEVPLRVSFRSAPAILRAADAVFAAEAARSGVSRDPVSHTAFRAEGAGRVEVWPLLTLPEGEQKAQRLNKPEDWTLPTGYETARNPSAELADRLAAQIKEWIEKGETVYDREMKADRPMNAGDVLVLVQRRGPFVEQLVRALKARAVPVSGADRMVLTEQLAVMDLIALLQFALLPEDDLTLACVLRGPLIGASEDDLMNLAIARKGSLWEALKKSSRVDWTAYLQSIAALADQKPPLQVLTHVLTSPCPGDPQSGRRAFARRLGPDAEDPIDELLNFAELFSQRRTPSLQAFLGALQESEAEIKREMEQAGGRVRIMTVHASKGLEAPIVILPDTARVPEKTKLSKLLLDEEGMPFYLPRDPRSAKLRELREAAQARQMEENRRLLYVALTRPADRLIVCGYAKSEKIPDQSWYRLIAGALKPLDQKDAFAFESGSFTPEIVIADYIGKTKRDARLRGHDEKRDDGTQQKRHSRDLSRRSVVKAESGSPVSLDILPSWLLVPPPPEPSPPRPFTPSRPTEEEPPSLSPQDARFKRGRIIHRLLQSLPDVDASRREDAARRFLANPQHELIEAQQKEMADEVLRLLADERFAPFWGPDSRAEVPIVGLVGSRLISGQMDRLVLVGEEVWALDYKTNRPPPQETKDIPPAYLGQMEAYRAVLAEVYPAKTIRCFLLWTHAPRLMEIPRRA